MRPYLLYRSSALGPTHGRVGLQYLDSPDAERAVTPLQRERVHFAAGRGICLQAKRGVVTSYNAVLFDRNLAVQHSVALAGAPSRARMSADGTMAAMLGEREAVYALPNDAPGATAATHSWAMAADGKHPPRLLVRLAFSPAVVQ